MFYPEFSSNAAINNYLNVYSICEYEVVFEEFEDELLEIVLKSSIS